MPKTARTARRLPVRTVLVAAVIALTGQLTALSTADGANGLKAAGIHAFGMPCISCGASS